MPKPKTLAATLALASALSPLHGAEPRKSAVDSKFVALTSSAVALTLWDAAQTRGCLSHVPGCAEQNPLYGSHPGPGRVYGQSLALTAGATFSAYLLRRYAPPSLKRLWYTPLAGIASGHALGIALSEHGYHDPTPQSFTLTPDPHPFSIPVRTHRKGGF